jgi:hypothetical protein
MSGCDSLRSGFSSRVSPSYAQGEDPCPTIQCGGCWARDNPEKAAELFGVEKLLPEAYDAFSPTVPAIRGLQRECQEGGNCPDFEMMLQGDTARRGIENSIQQQDDWRAQREQWYDRPCPWYKPWACSPGHYIREAAGVEAGLLIMPCRSGRSTYRASIRPPSGTPVPQDRRHADVLLAHRVLAVDRDSSAATNRSLWRDHRRAVG